MAIYRKRVFHETRKNYQLDLFDPDDGTWEYAAVATNLEMGVGRLWRFMAGRGPDMRRSSASSKVPWPSILSPPTGTRPTARTTPGSTRWPGGHRDPTRIQYADRLESENGTPLGTRPGQRMDRFAIPGRERLAFSSQAAWDILQSPLH